VEEKVEKKLKTQARRNETESRKKKKDVEMIKE
jgi:hypothetical protein